MNEEEMLNFLMTSEFEGDYSPSELKSLLSRWRYFYRLLYGRMERVKDRSESEVKRLNDEIFALRLDTDRLRMKSLHDDTVIDMLKSRRLTWKERISGKIITNEDEDK